MNYTYREGREIVVSEIREIAETLPFFAERRLLILENSGLFKKGGDELAAYVPEIPETTVIVFVEEEVDKRSKLWKAVDKCGHAVECSRRTEDDLKKFVLEYLTKNGQRITEQAMELFLERTGDDMGHIVTELEKLTAYTAGRDVLPEDVAAITSVTAQNRVFEMLDLMLRRQPKAAMERYADLMALREPPMRILYLMTQQVNRLLQVKEGLAAGKTQDQLAEEMGLRSFAVRKYAGQSRRFDGETLRARLGKLIGLEEAVKTGDMEDALAVELALTMLSGKND